MIRNESQRGQIADRRAPQQITQRDLKADGAAKTAARRQRKIVEVLALNFVLTGVPAMSQLWMSRPEIRRRAHVVWMRPYGIHDEDDRKHFVSLLRSIESDYPFERGVLRALIEEIFLETAGIVGELIRLADDSLMRAQQGGRSEITASDIRASFHNDAAGQRMWEDVRMFEELRAPGSPAYLRKLIQPSAPKPRKGHGEAARNAP